MQRTRIFSALLSLSLAVFATTAGAQESTIRQTLGKRMPQLKPIEEVRPTAIPGLYEVRVNGADIYYTDAKGNYLIQGNLYETKDLTNLTEQRVQKLTAIKFDSLPLKDAITIVRGNGARKVAVFEDPNCGYCKRFERDLQKVDNVTVYLFLYPILGQDSTDKAKAIWCSKDKSQAWLDWMLRDVLPTPAAAMCDTTPLARNTEFGKTYRIQGTPALIFEDGSRVPGAIDTQQIERHLKNAKG